MSLPDNVDRDALAFAWNSCNSSREAFQVLQRTSDALRALPDEGEKIVGSLVGLVESIRRVHDDLLRPTRPLRIVFAGASPFEMIMDVHYGPVLARLLGIPSVLIHYVAINAEESASVVEGQVPPDIKGRIFPMLLAQYARLVEEKPDLICMFHPGMRREWEMWLPDSGLASYVKAGVPIVVAGWSPLESRIDARYLEASGYQLSADLTNLLAPAIPHTDGEKACSILRRIDGLDRDAQPSRALQVLQFEIDTQDVVEANLDEATKADLVSFLDATESGSYEARMSMRARFIGMLNRMHWSDYAARRWMHVCAGRVPESTAYHHEYVRSALMLGKPEWAIAHLDRHGGAPNARNGWGETPLMLAAMFNNHELMTALLNRGAEINAISDYGYTALEMAMLGGHEDLALALLERGAKADLGGQSMGVERAAAKAHAPMPRLNMALSPATH